MTKTVLTFGNGSTYGALPRLMHGEDPRFGRDSDRDALTGAL